MRNLFAFLAGGLFGTGLYVSGMTDTSKVQGWLDVFGAWDPTLAFVMGGAMIPMAIAWLIVERAKAPVAGGSFPAKPSPKLGRNLILGSTLFGMGWGLAGLCPGPAIASLSYNGLGGVVFVIAMGLGMLATPALRSRLDRAVPAE
ncbi:DUF6691 family protein [Pseudooceanicola nanhaiensis]|uniref:DUF6691 family protein n=1 Tax=Pseudooceanicola nanhaiensis TaxID=375761 RepID=UPI001CD623A8|nr:DUF6691 family protein [Pseudooceanicola nanhaiensis]MCA0919359.1 hypothetical protein [Pseudooceanicola nanhaiensis]